MSREAVVEHPSGTGWSRFVTAPPGPALRGHVRRYTGYAEYSAVPLRRREVPSPDAALIVSLGPWLDVVGQGRHGSFVAGVHEAPATTEFTGEQLGIQVDLTPLAARRLLGVPMAEVGRPVVGLGDLLGREADLLAERLAEVDGWDERFALLDAALARRLHEAEPTPPEVGWAWGTLVGSRGRRPVRAVATELGWSERRLLRAFRVHVGPAPKTFARMLRFHRAVERLRTEREPDLGRIALECGYYDQAHFNRDFRAFAGAPPTEFLRRLLPGDAGVDGG
jgi:AraC-like DNA-binding protein